jgi:protocatechuate 3,4-dioxygenase, beta subunit
MPKLAQERTPNTILGPYYPLHMIEASETNIYDDGERNHPAEGTLIGLYGRVLNFVGEAVSEAQIEIWQSDQPGWYRHPSTRAQRPDDVRFNGFARMRSGLDGSYRFRTVIPGSYIDGGRHLGAALSTNGTLYLNLPRFDGQFRRAIATY